MNDSKSGVVHEIIKSVEFCKTLHQEKQHGDTEEPMGQEPLRYYRPQPKLQKTIKELQDKEVVFTATFSKPDQKAKWAFKGEEIFKGKQIKIEVLEDENKELTIHQLTIKKPMYKNMGKYTVTCNEVQTGSYLDVEGE